MKMKPHEIFEATACCRRTVKLLGLLFHEATHFVMLSFCLRILCLSGGGFSGIYEIQDLQFTVEQ